MRKCQLATHLADMPILPTVKVTTEEKVLSMYGQQYEEPSNIQEEYNPKVHGESMEKKLQSVINSTGEQSALLFMAVSDCIVNKKSQVEIARKYGIPRSRVQYSARSQKLRRNEKELERVDDRPTPVIESHNSEDDSDTLLDVQL